MELVGTLTGHNGEVTQVSLIPASSKVYFRDVIWLFPRLYFFQGWYSKLPFQILFKAIFQGHFTAILRPTLFQHYSKTIIQNHSKASLRPVQRSLCCHGKVFFFMQLQLGPRFFCWVSWLRPTFQCYHVHSILHTELVIHCVFVCFVCFCLFLFVCVYVCVSRRFLGTVLQASGWQVLKMAQLEYGYVHS